MEKFVNGRTFTDVGNNNIKIISEKLNVPINLKKHNSSRHHHYRDYYDEESKEMVSKLYKEDIEMFGYEF